MQTYEKARNGDYKNLMEYPADFHLAKPKLATLTPDEGALREYQLKLSNWQRLQAEGIKARDAWRRENERLEAQLEADLAEENGLLDHPKRSVLWSKAWDAGHSSGYAEVCLAYTDLAELLT